MLYVTTRDNRNPVTAYRAIHALRGPDGGFYLPFRHPKFSEKEIESLMQMSFGECVSEILNRLFNTRLTAWDVDFYCGRTPVRLHALAHKTIVAEAWHTPTETFDQIARGVAGRVSENSEMISDWVNIAVRTAAWFGVFGELKRCGIKQADISVVSGDFSLPISAWYARHWGLPIGRIVCCCNENNTVWELLCHGQMRTDALSIPTMIPEADISVPAGLERLIYEAGGTSEVLRFLDALRHGIPYRPGDSVLTKLREGMYSVVVSSQRLEGTIPGVVRSHGYLMSPGTALSYAGLQDYRAKTGGTGPTVIWAEEHPAAKAELLSAILDIPAEEIPELYNTI